MSLRRRLLAGILVLLVVAIGVADAVTYSSLRSFLLGRLDEQTDVAQAQLVVALDAAYHRAIDTSTSTTAAELAADPTTWLRHEVVVDAPVDHGCRSSLPATTGSAPATTAGPSGGATRFGPFDRVSPDVFVEVLTQHRQLLLARPSGTCDPRPVLPGHMPVQAAPTSRRFGAEGGAYFPNQLSFTTGSVSSSTTYRAEAVAIPGGILVTAVSLSPDEQTLASTVHVEAVTSLAVLVAAVLLALLVTRLGLRPLDEMTETAGAIADGDLGRRIRTTDTRNEVGRLGHALNGMLTQMEAALDQRTRSERRLRRFVADASHELRTPLTSIRGYAELLRKGALADEAARAQAVTRIEREAARMGVLVEDLLLLARLDQGRPLDELPVDLSRVAEEAVGDALVTAADHPVTVDLPGPVPVTGDAVRLRQVVDNLVGNALEHTPPGTPVTVSVAAEGDAAVLRVADRGPGLPEDVAAQVFEPFFRAGTTRTREGAGLGLAIVAALAQAHGGTAAVRPGPGGGCLFEVRLPLATQPSTAVEGSGGPVTDGAVDGDRPGRAAPPGRAGAERGGAGVGGPPR